MIGRVSDFENRYSSVVFRAISAALLMALASAVASPAFARSGKEEEVPVTRVMRGDVDLKVYTTGELRATRSAMLTAPPVAGGTLQIIHLVKTGTIVKAKDMVIEFDPTEQEFNLAQNRSELMQAEQEISKAKADSAVHDAQDQVALLKAKFAVRQAELDVTRNELLPAIDAKKNLLALEEAKRALAQLEQDIKSRAASNRAALAVSEEKRNKARIAMQTAQQNIDNMRVPSPINGLVEVRQNREAAGGFVSAGMTLPAYREGDQVFPGAFIAQVLDTDDMEISAKVNESDRANLKAGQQVEVHVNALPGVNFAGKVKVVAGTASGDMWGGDTLRKFDASVQLNKPDERLRPGFTAQLVILGNQIKDALYLPRQAIFEKNGKPVVYVKNGSDFEARDVKVKYRTESRVAIEGLKEGAEVALVNPETLSKKPRKVTGPLPAMGGGPR